MRYLSGAPHPDAMRWEYGGVMFTPEMRNRLDLSGVTWAADNGCYTAGARFSIERWLAFLTRWRGQGSCLFAVLPDAPFSHADTLTCSLPHVASVRDMGYTPALAIQEGATVETIPWDCGIGAIFIAGGKPRPAPLSLWGDATPRMPPTRAFKTSDEVKRIVREAKRRGFYVHSARCNSRKALQAAYDVGADSVDGTYLRFAPDKNWKRLQGWLADLCPHADAVPVWGTDTRFRHCPACGCDVMRY